jgi:hypothetical protein
MRAIVSVLVVFLVVEALLLAVAAAIGLGLNWCNPEIEIGMGILIGVVSSTVAAYTLVRILTMEWHYEIDDEDQDDLSAEATVDLAPPASRRRPRSKKR